MNDTNWLTDLAATINHEHQLVYGAALDVLEHAIACGVALIEARESVPDGQWGRWVTTNLDMPIAAVGRYTRIATFREYLHSTEHKPQSINAAINYLRDIGAISGTGRNGRHPTFDVDEARRLKQLGMTNKDIGAVLGVSDVAVWRQLTPGATERAVAISNRLRSRRRKEQRALREQELDARVAGIGGNPAIAYALLRKAAITLDQALQEANDDEWSATLHDALTYTHRAEDAITRALGISRGRRHS